MDILTIFNEINSNTTNQTNKQYLTKLNKIYDGKPILDLNLLLDTEKIKKFLNQEKFKSSSTKRSYLTPVILLLRKFHPKSDALQIYEKLNNDYILAIFNEINSNTTINTNKQYLTKLNKIYDGKPILDLNLLLDTEKIKKFLNQEKFKSSSTKRSYLTPVILLLRKFHPKSDALQIYEKLNNDYRNDYTKRINEQGKSEKELDNWVKWSELIEIREKITDEAYLMKDQTFLKNNKQKKLLDYALISGLYTLIPPVRLDYNNMNVYYNKILKELPTNENYILINKKEKMRIVLNVYKTSKNYDQIIINTPPKLTKLIKFYLKFNKKILEGVTENNLSKLISKVFTINTEVIDKKINLNLIRHIYISNKVSLKTIEKNKKLSNAMAHSPTTQTGYIRV